MEEFTKNSKLLGFENVSTRNNFFKKAKHMGIDCSKYDFLISLKSEANSSNVLLLVDFKNNSLTFFQDNYSFNLAPVQSLNKFTVVNDLLIANLVLQHILKYIIKLNFQ